MIAFGIGSVLGYSIHQLCIQHMNSDHQGYGVVRSTMLDWIIRSRKKSDYHQWIANQYISYPALSPTVHTSISTHLLQHRGSQLVMIPSWPSLYHSNRDQYTHHMDQLLQCIYPHREHITLFIDPLAYASSNLLEAMEEILVFQSRHPDAFVPWNAPQGIEDTVEAVDVGDAIEFTGEQADRWEATLDDTFRPVFYVDRPGVDLRSHPIPKEDRVPELGIKEAAELWQVIQAVQGIAEVAIEHGVSLTLPSLQEGDPYYHSRCYFQQCMEREEGDWDEMAFARDEVYGMVLCGGGRKYVAGLPSHFKEIPADRMVWVGEDSVQLWAEAYRKIIA